MLATIVLVAVAMWYETTEFTTWLRITVSWGGALILPVVLAGFGFAITNPKECWHKDINDDFCPKTAKVINIFFTVLTMLLWVLFVNTGSPLLLGLGKAVLLSFAAREILGMLIALISIAIIQIRGNK